MKTLKIESFKCFSEAEVPFNDMTILCGPNAGGKSTIIQAILLLELSCRTTHGTVAINGPFGLQLGEAEELFSRNFESTGETDAIRLSFFDEDLCVRSASLFASENFPRRLLVKDVGYSVRDDVPLFDFVYLSAERRGPRTTQETHSDDQYALQTLGHVGEFTAEVLGRFERVRVREAMRFSSVGSEAASSSALMLGCVQEWMSTLFGPTEILVKPNGIAPPSIYFKRPGIAEDWTIASNTGFGLSYALPVIVAGLLVPEGGTFIVDSPEAHLHPAAQTAIARFLCCVAASGVNVILETHSDYILDGVRISLTESNQNRLKREKCTFLSISIGEENRREIETITISEKGKPSHWPKGFFDQQIINMQAIDKNIRTPKNG